MRTHPLTVPMAAFVMVFSALGAEAQRAERGNRGNQGERQRSQTEGSGRQGPRVAQNQGQRGGQANRAGASAQRGGSPVVARGTQGSGAVSRDYAAAAGAAPRGAYSAEPRRGYNNTHNSGNRGGYGYNEGHNSGYGKGYSKGYGGARYYGGAYRSGYYTPAYYAPRPLHYRYAPRHYYGQGGHLGIYVGFGSGYFYGAAYSGPVYGYRAPVPAYREPRNYGDVRLQVYPRDAAVYVDGYYAGIVDDFDGSSKPLVLEAGPHKIEIAAPGVEPQVFDVYVDPQRSVELHADLLREAR